MRVFAQASQRVRLRPVRDVPNLHAPVSARADDDIFVSFAPRAVVHPIARVKPAQFDEISRQRVDIADDLRAVTDDSKVLRRRYRDSVRHERGKLHSVAVEPDGAVRRRRHGARASECEDLSNLQRDALGICEHLRL